MTTARGSGFQKLGQPVPLSNFVAELNSGMRAAGADEGSLAMLLQQRAREWRLGRSLAKHCDSASGRASAATRRRAVDRKMDDSALSAATAEQQQAHGCAARKTQKRAAVVHRTPLPPLE